MCTWRIEISQMLTVVTWNNSNKRVCWICPFYLWSVCCVDRFPALPFFKLNAKPQCTNLIGSKTWFIIVLAALLIFDTDVETCLQFIQITCRYGKTFRQISITFVEGTQWSGGTWMQRRRIRRDHWVRSLLAYKNLAMLLVHALGVCIGTHFQKTSADLVQI